MSKKAFYRTLTFGVLLSSLISLNAFAIESHRVNGKNRFDTCTQITSLGFKNTQSNYAILATGNNYADAISAAPLAKKFDAPVFLVNKDNIDYNPSTIKTTEELKRLGVIKVFIIGGKYAISDKVEKQLQSMNIQYERIQGGNREQTSLEVAKKIGCSNGIFVTNGYDDFRDALSASSIAAQKNMPILLVGKSSVDKNITDYINSNNVEKSYLVGNESLLNNSVQSKFKNVETIYGNSYSERNVKIIKRFHSDLNFDNIFLVTSKDYPDAISVAAYACNLAAPILLVNNEDNSEIKEALVADANNINNIYVIGGQAAITDSTQAAINNIIDSCKNFNVVDVE